MERIGVTDIGGKSDKLFAEETFGMWVTNAFFPCRRRFTNTQCFIYQTRNNIS